MLPILLAISFAAHAAAQHSAEVEPEIHPKLSWKRCSGTGCETVNGEIVIDSNWRWLHEVDGDENCFEWGGWNDDICNSVESCTEGCALDGANYRRTYGITARNSSLSMRYLTHFDFTSNANSRVFLMQDEETYQTFTLLGNEIAVDVDLSTVVCGLNAAFYFVAMEADGGMTSYPSNRAGAKYGTGYCDASCPQSSKFNGGRANYDDWTTSETDEANGRGRYGSCCAEFDVLNSNAYSYSMSAKPCIDLDYHVCEEPYCDYERGFFERSVTCDKVVTQFDEAKVSQFFMQDGQRIELPTPAVPDFPDDNGLTEDYCRARTWNFQEWDRFEQIGGFEQHAAALQQPMVLAMAITDDASHKSLLGIVMRLAIGRT
ncbi:hypothetical protein S7711_08126 [Stachybotrys chartarum IBT 7711]|uniref:Glucanase n=1 Tax=Stachybotrys chartarum (strain CBS 109288 / IBT 7711) TaxID=1280523 RepID=A0A084AVN9_STACB|nr:hypothetical protein S7711_08126 [Stachybotrys chartarum IBT 7711]